MGVEELYQPKWPGGQLQVPGLPKNHPKSSTDFKSNLQVTAGKAVGGGGRMGEVEITYTHPTV